MKIDWEEDIGGCRLEGGGKGEHAASERKLCEIFLIFQCVPGVVVETGGCYGDDSFQDDKVEWLHITTQPLLSKLLVHTFIGPNCTL